MEKVFIEGTGKKPDYLVIASKGHIVLGLKPVLENLVGKDYEHLSVIGFRLRSVSKVKVIDTGVLIAPWPKITFNARDTTRASCTVGAGVERVHVSTVEMLGQFLAEHNAATKLAQQVIDMVGDDCLYSVVELSDFIAATYAEVIDKNKPEEDFDKAAVVAGANVIDLQAAALSKAIDKYKFN